MSELKQKLPNPASCDNDIKMTAVVVVHQQISNLESFPVVKYGLQTKILNISRKKIEQT